MIIFLTSSHTLGWAGPLNPANGLVDALRDSLPSPLRCVMISSYPDDKKITDRMAWETRETFEWADMPFSHFEVLDRRTQRHAARMLRKANFIVLCGGHVPTENAFLQQLNLRERLQGFDGVMLTISAGSMNCASNVFAPPELEGEAVDPDYVQYMPGLGLTEVNIIPHFRQLRRARIDGRRLMYDLVAPSTFNHPVYCLPDGSFFIITPDRTELRGDAWRMRNGKLTRVCRDGERRRLTPGGHLRLIGHTEY